MKGERQYRCDTCGQTYESSGHDYERGDGMMVWILDKPHRCALPHGRFFLRTETEREYRNGVLYTRTVTYRKGSSHDVPFDTASHLESFGEWKSGEEPGC